MKNDLFTETERQVISAYQSRTRAVGNVKRLSFQYLLGAGLFVAVAILFDEPLFALATYAVFVAFVVVRLVGVHRSSDAMAAILSKYEARVQELEMMAAKNSEDV